MSDPILVNLGDEIDVYGERFVCVLVEKQTHGYPRVEFISKAEAEAEAEATSWVENSQVFAKNLRAYEEESAMALGITKEARGYAEGQCNAISPREYGSLYCRRLPGHPSGASKGPGIGYSAELHINGTQGWE